MATTKLAPRAAFLAVAIGAVALLQAAGCSDDETQKPGSTGGGNDAGATTFATTPCGVCAQGACQPQVDACNADPECAGYLACLLACAVDEHGNADAACDAACPHGQSTEAQKAQSELGACRTKGCGGQCPECGVVTPTTYESPLLTQTCPDPSTETTPCNIAEDERCCETYAAYVASPEAIALKNCWNDCVDANGENCEKTCYEQHPDGGDIMGARWACLQVRCSVEAAGGTCDPATLDPDLRCWYEKCGDEWAAFLGGPDGFALYGCIVACPVDDAVCQQACYDQWSAAFERYAPFVGCAAVACQGGGKC